MSMVAFRGKSRVGTPVLAGRREQAVAPARLSNVVNLTVLARPPLARGRPLSSGTPMGLTPMGLLASLPAPDFALLLVGITACLGSALAWAFWEMEQRLKPLCSRPVR